MTDADRDREERLSELRRLEEWLEGPMLVLSLVWLLIVLAELIYGTSQTVELIGLGIWGIFVLEFGLRFTLAPAKLPFLKRNWLTVVALVVPAFRLLRGFRLLRAARALRGARLVRIVGTANRSMAALRRTLRRRRFGYVMGLTALILALGAAGMMSFEPAHEVEGGFSSYWEAFWWTAMMISAIGSEFWPVTVEGRILCFLLSLYGLGVFGYVTASFATFFIGRDAGDEEAELVGVQDVRALRDEIAALRAAIEQSGRGPAAPIGAQPSARSGR